jgi:23S rRNA pseudouridine1911/1915/1917 synthase
MKKMLLMFKKRELKKQYVALSHGSVSPQKGVINLPIKRSSMNRSKFEVAVDGKEAVTAYEVREGLAYQGSLKKKYQDNFSLIDLWPQTGRTHQIRVHLAHIHAPIVADQLYAGRKRSKLDTGWCERQFLHAAQIEFVHPVTDEKLKIVAPLSEDLMTALEHLDGV